MLSSQKLYTFSKRSGRMRISPLATACRGQAGEDRQCRAEQSRAKGGGMVARLMVCLAAHQEHSHHDVGQTGEKQSL